MAYKVRSFPRPSSSRSNANRSRVRSTPIPAERAELRINAVTQLVVQGTNATKQTASK